MKKLTHPLKGELHTIEMFNDDLTPMKYVVQILYGCFNHDELTAIKAMMNIHETSYSQVLAGDREVLNEVIAFIQEDARCKKFPLKLSIVD